MHTAPAAITPVWFKIYCSSCLFYTRKFLYELELARELTGVTDILLIPSTGILLLRACTLGTTEPQSPITVPHSNQNMLQISHHFSRRHCKISQSHRTSLPHGFHWCDSSDPQDYRGPIAVL